MPNKPSISISISHPDWKSHSAKLKAIIRSACSLTLKELTAGAASVSIQLSDDAALHALNHDFRGKDKPTNVLSFPDGEADEDGIVHLGDIAVSMDTVAREADIQGKTLEAHLAHMIVHATLHLLGHDHEEDSQAEAMETLEINILTKMGIDNPYR